MAILAAAVASAPTAVEAATFRAQGGAASKSFNGTNVGQQTFTAAGTGPSVTFTCGSSTYQGTVTSGSTSLLVSTGVGLCTATVAGTVVGTTSSCSGPWKYDFASAAVQSNGTVRDTAAAPAKLQLPANGCDKSLGGTGCSLRFTTPTPVRFNTDGRPADDGIYSGASSGTFPSSVSVSTVKPAFRAYMKASGLTVSTTPGRNCSAFGFAPGATYTTGTLGGNTAVAATASPSAPATSAALAEQNNDVYLQ